MAMAPMGKYDRSFNVLHSVSALIGSKNLFHETVTVILAAGALQGRCRVIGA